MQNWAYGATPLNNGSVGTIYYSAGYYEITGIKNPTHADYYAYTTDEIAAIKDGAVEGSESYWNMFPPATVLPRTATPQKGYPSSHLRTAPTCHDATMETGTVLTRGVS